MLSRPNMVMNHGRPAAGSDLPRPATGGEKRSAARSTRLRRYVDFSESRSHSSRGASSTQASRLRSMFGRARLWPRAYFGRTNAPLAPAAGTTSRSVVHSPPGSMRAAKVRPCSSIFAGALAEIAVARWNVSRSYPSTSRFFSTRAE